MIASGPPETRPRTLSLSPCRSGQVVDQQHDRRAVLEGVGGLVPEGRVVAVLLAGERTVVPVLLRLAADDQDRLALDVDAGVVVVVELQRAVLGRDAVAGEDDRQTARPNRSSRWPAG